MLIIWHLISYISIPTVQSWGRGSPCLLARLRLSWSSRWNINEAVSRRVIDPSAPSASLRTFYLQVSTEWADEGKRADHHGRFAGWSFGAGLCFSALQLYQNESGASWEYSLHTWQAAANVCARGDTGEQICSSIHLNVSAFEEEKEGARGRRLTDRSSAAFSFFCKREASLPSLQKSYLLSVLFSGAWSMQESPASTSAELSRSDLMHCGRPSCSPGAPASKTQSPPSFKAKRAEETRRPSIECYQELSCSSKQQEGKHVGLWRRPIRSERRGGEVEYRRRGRGGAPTSYLSPVVSADVFLKGWDETRRVVREKRRSLSVLIRWMFTEPAFKWAWDILLHHQNISVQRVYQDDRC